MVDLRLARDLRLTWARGWLVEHYNSSATSFRKVRKTWSQCMPRSVFTPHTREKHGGWYKTYFISLKPVLAFQNLTQATLGKLATSQERVFFLGKNCSWTLLPRINLTLNADKLIILSCIWSFRPHFASLKRVDHLRVYQGFMMPLNHQAGIEST